MSAVAEIDRGWIPLGTGWTFESIGQLLEAFEIDPASEPHFRFLFSTTGNQIDERPAIRIYAEELSTWVYMALREDGTVATYVTNIKPEVFPDLESFHEFWGQEKNAYRIRPVPVSFLEDWK